MGQNTSITESIPDALEIVQYEAKKQAKILSEMGSLTYEDFQKCLTELNELSRKCLDAGGKQLIFAIKKGTDTSMLWKATVRIACVKLNISTRQIDSYKFLNLKQFLNVFHTFQSHLEVMNSTEQQKESTEKLLNASLLLNEIGSPTTDGSNEQDLSSLEPLNECCICLERKPEIILPCAHTYCCPCIEQWNVNNKTCPICQDELASTDDSWVLSDLPKIDEINQEICTELMNLSKNK